MKHKVFSVYDSKVEAYHVPFFAPTVGAAIRMFADAVGDSGSQFAKHAEDYTLFLIGEYDDQHARLEPVAALQSLGCALEFVKTGGV